MISRIVNSRLLCSKNDPQTLATAASEARVDGVLLDLDPQGEIRGAGDVAGVRVALCRKSDHLQDHFAVPDAQRDEHVARTCQLIRTARELQAAAVEIAPALWGEHDHGRVTYDDALAAGYNGLCDLVPDAECYGVDVLIGACAGRFVTSPLEMRELIDRIASARIGVVLDWAGVARFSDPRDWLAILGRRVRFVQVSQRCCELAPGEFRRDLEGVCFDGAVLLDCSSDAASGLAWLSAACATE